MQECNAGCDLDADTLDLESLSPGLQEQILAEVQDMGLDEGGMEMGMMGQVIPRKLEAFPFFGGLTLGAGGTTVLTQVLSQQTGARPIYFTGGASLLTLLAHLVSGGKSFTLGLFGGTVPLLLAQGTSALLDAIYPGAEAGAASIPQVTTSPTGPQTAGAGKGMGQLTKRTLDEMKRLVSRLEPSRNQRRAPAQAAGAYPEPSYEMGDTSYDMGNGFYDYNMGMAGSIAPSY